MNIETKTKTHDETKTEIEAKREAKINAMLARHTPTEIASAFYFAGQAANAWRAYDWTDESPIVAHWDHVEWSDSTRCARSPLENDVMTLLAGETVLNAYFGLTQGARALHKSIHRETGRLTFGYRLMLACHELRGPDLRRARAIGMFLESDNRGNMWMWEERHASAMECLKEELAHLLMIAEPIAEAILDARGKPVDVVDLLTPDGVKTWHQTNAITWSYHLAGEAVYLLSRGHTGIYIIPGCYMVICDQGTHIDRAYDAGKIAVEMSVAVRSDWRPPACVKIEAALRADWERVEEIAMRLLHGGKTTICIDGGTPEGFERAAKVAAENAI